MQGEAAVRARPPFPRQLVPRGPGLPGGGLSGECVASQPTDPGLGQTQAGSHLEPVGGPSPSGREGSQGGGGWSKAVAVTLALQAQRTGWPSPAQRPLPHLVDSSWAGIKTSRFQNPRCSSRPSSALIRSESLCICSLG